MLVASLALHQIKEVGTSSRETNSAEFTTSLHRNNSNNTKLDISHIPTLQKIKIV